MESDLSATFGIVDLFAGPGGLGEGFASVKVGAHFPFQIGISIEKEAAAHRTLSLRAFLRSYRHRTGTLPEQFLNFHAGQISEPEWSEIDAEAWRHASNEARCLELGTLSAASAIDDAIEFLKHEYDDTILIGGPPCQAYSLVGRARARGNAGYVPEEDPRHYLFREYISVLDRLRPAVFVMENVKGMLSSTVESRRVFDMLMEDLSSLGRGRGQLYDLRAIRVEDGIASLAEAAAPTDFVIRAELFGVPQRRHRVIIVGIRSDIAANATNAAVAVSRKQRVVYDVIGNLPPLCSGLSLRKGISGNWREVVIDAAADLSAVASGEGRTKMARAFSAVSAAVASNDGLSRSSSILPAGYGKSDDDLLAWLERPELIALAQHETRGHMSTDLSRYLFAAVFGAEFGYSPKSKDFPASLSPNHKNWGTGIFDDRFRVQIAGEPSTTVTSHISKDGHYFIHPDPLQCRSLTVREAARLQTFPDDYYFLGNRTQQYVQVGNAVPPFLANQIASLIYQTLIN